MGKCSPSALNLGTGEKGTVRKLNMDLIFLGDSVGYIKTYELMKCIELLRTEFKASDITVYSIGKTSVFARIAEILDESIKTEYKNEISIHDIVTNKYYDEKDIESLIMPEIAEYLR